MEVPGYRTGLNRSVLQRQRDSPCPLQQSAAQPLRPMSVYGSTLAYSDNGVYLIN